MDEGAQDYCAGDGDEQAGARRRASLDADQYECSGCDVLEASAMDRGGEGTSTGGRDDSEGSGRRVVCKASMPRIDLH